MTNEKNRLILGFDFRFTLNERGGLKPAIIKCEGDYKKNFEKISNLLSVRNIEEILKILSVSKDINSKDLEALIDITHPSMWEHLTNLESLDIITKEKKKLEGERKEFKINLSPNVSAVQLAVFEYTEKVNEDTYDKFSSSNSEVLARIGVPSKQIVNDKNTPKIISEYIQKIKKKLQDKLK